MGSAQPRPMEKWRNGKFHALAVGSQTAARACLCLTPKLKEKSNEKEKGQKARRGERGREREEKNEWKQRHEADWALESGVECAGVHAISSPLPSVSPLELAHVFGLDRRADPARGAPSAVVIVVLAAALATTCACLGIFGLLVCIGGQTPRSASGCTLERASERAPRGEERDRATLDRLRP